MDLPKPELLSIMHASDVSRARQIGRAAAVAVGFTEEGAEEVALVLTELATNLLKHAGGGELCMSGVRQEGRVGLEIESTDNGPGIPDINAALTDRYSTRGSRGTGLGAVNRLMDELDITSPPRAGTRVRCRKWVRNYAPSLRLCPLAVGVATRPQIGGSINGDAFVLKRWSESLLVGVIDGLGHGPFAHRAAQTAANFVNSHFDLPLDQIFRGTGRACRATRGVVMALARFDWGRNSLQLASIGNIEARVLSEPQANRFIVRRGVLGGNAPPVAVTGHAWSASNLLLLHSDGVATHWTWKDHPGLAEQPASAVAAEVLRLHARDNDDATVLVVGPVRP